MKLKTIESSNIEAIGWEETNAEEQTGTLRVAFKAGKQYDYADVPAEVYEEMRLLPSAGRYLRSVVAGLYQYSIVPEDEHSAIEDEEEG